MRAKLNDLTFQLQNLDCKSRDLKLMFKYEKLNDYELKLYVIALIGSQSHDDYRFCLKFMYYIDGVNLKNMDDHYKEKNILSRITDLVTPDLQDIVMIVDSMIENTDEKELTIQA